MPSRYRSHPGLGLSADKVAAMADKIQFNLYLDRNLVREIRLAAVAADMKVSDYVAEVLNARLDRDRRVADRVSELFSERLEEGTQ